MKFGEQFIKTKVQYITLNPVRNEGFEFDVTKDRFTATRNSRKLIVKAFDKGTVPNPKKVMNILEF